jgi:hypothetical protein
MGDRLRVLRGHLRWAPAEEDAAALAGNDCIGEMENRQVDEDLERHASSGGNAVKKKGSGLFPYRFARQAIKIVFPDTSAADERYGGSGRLSWLLQEM